MCPLGRKVVPCNTEGRSQLDKPAPAPVRRPRALGWGPARKAGASGEPGAAGEGPRGSPGSAGWGHGGLGSLGQARPASPGTAAWTRTACRWCVLVSILCPPVHDMLERPPVPIPGTPKLPADCVPVPGNGLSCVVRHGAGKNFPCSHTLVVPVSGRLRRARICGDKAAGPLGSSGGATGWGEGPPPSGLHNRFFPVCLSLFFPLALSVSSLLIRSPNPPAFTVEKPDTQVSGASGAAHASPALCPHSAHLVGGAEG